MPGYAGVLAPLDDALRYWSYRSWENRLPCPAGLRLIA